MSFDYPREIRFECTRCALCCGDTETRVRHVVMLRREAEQISRATSLSIEKFATAIESQEPYVFEMRKTVDDGKCMFLKDNHCTIYASRPLVCRFYPFELRAQSSGRHVFCYTEECPGIGKGRLPLNKAYFDYLFQQI